MRCPCFLGGLAAAAAILVVALLPSRADAPALVSYQGKLSDSSGQPVANASYSLTFALYNQASGGALLWTETHPSVPVTAGVFQVLLGSVTPLLDSAFEGSTWLEVRLGGNALLPRSRIVSAGYAMRARLADSVADNSITSTKLASDAASLAKVSGGAMASSGGWVGIGTQAPDAPLAISASQAFSRLTTTSNPWGAVLELRNNTASPLYIGAINFLDSQYYLGQIGYLGSNDLTFTVGGVERMRIAPTGYVGVGTTQPQEALDVNGMVRTSLVGTTDASALELFADGERVWLAQPMPSGSVNIVAGANSNAVTSGSYAGTVSGGAMNLVTDNYGVVGGGTSNQAGNNDAFNSDSAIATVAGGENNKATGTWSAIGGGKGNTAGGQYSAVSGGNLNTASGQYGAVGGGKASNASGSSATVGGGWYNTASGMHSTVPGGANNTAAGYKSFAAGNRAKANHSGSFVFSDDTETDVASTGNGQFIVRAYGGIWLGKTSTPSILSGRFINTSTGAYLSDGGTWGNASDRALKENFASVDGEDVLRKLASLPVATWNYRAERDDVRHIGPTSQDFARAFGLGDGDKTIATVDADGVALSAIQALYRMLLDVQAENRELRKALEELKSRP